MPGRTTTVLVVDDDARMARALTRLLEQEGWRCITVSNGNSALGVLNSVEANMVLTEALLPGLSGYELCARIRQSFSMMPVMIVTGRASDEDRVQGFLFGADDYVTKPFNPVELVLRLKALLRRSAPAAEDQAPLQNGELALDFLQKRVTVNGEDVPLTRTEYQLLCYLARNSGRLLTFSDILRHVWGEGYEEDMALVHVYVSRLRRKLGEDPRHPRYIFNRPGIGYSVQFDLTRAARPGSAPSSISA